MKSFSRPHLFNFSLFIVFFYPFPLLLLSFSIRRINCPLPPTTEKYIFNKITDHFRWKPKIKYGYFQKTEPPDKRDGGSGQAWSQVGRGVLQVHQKIVWQLFKLYIPFHDCLPIYRIQEIFRQKFHKHSDPPSCMVRPIVWPRIRGVFWISAPPPVNTPLSRIFLTCLFSFEVICTYFDSRSYLRHCHYLTNVF